MAKAVKKVAKKSAKKVAKKAASGRKVVRKSPEQKKAVFALLKRTNGATMADIHAAGYPVAAMAVLKMAERNGFKTKVVKKEGELTRYHAYGEAK